MVLLTNVKFQHHRTIHFAGNIVQLRSMEFVNRVKLILNVKRSMVQGIRVRVGNIFQFVDNVVRTLQMSIVQTMVYNVIYMVVAAV
jgi:hypothetical protein